MSNNNDPGLFVNFVMSMLLRKIVVPSGYRDRVKAVREMLEDDVSGLVDSLTDFAVDTATVNFMIETKNENFTKILKKWLDTVNISYNGQIPSGIKPLAKEYFKERWKYSSFPILKISKWETIDNVIVPSKMFFVDGESIYAKDKNEEDENLKIVNYDYYLGSKAQEKLDKNVIITKPYSRWFDKYPTPFLIKRGVYHNWKIVQSLKKKETEILDQIIPYMMLIKKGTEGLARDHIKSYTNEELKQTIKQMQDLMNTMKSTNLGEHQVKSPIRATNFDEEIKHLIPNISDIFDGKLFAVAERNILSGLGFIDVVEATSTSRRESILNPKAFIEEVKTGVEDFKQIIKELVIKIVEKNKSHIKYINNDVHISSSPVRGFMTDDFKKQIRGLYDRGRISSKTAVELVAEVDFETEVLRRKKESEKGIDYTMYPPIIQNREGEGIDIPEEENIPPKETDEEDIPDDKKGIEKENYNMSSLEGAPYQNIKDLPERVKKNLSPSLQNVFMEAFNKAYQTYKNDSRAFRVAWGVIKKIAKKGKNGKWVRKSSRTKLTKAMLEEVLEKEEQQTIDETMKLKELEIKEKQNKLLDKLLNRDKNEVI